MKTRTNTDAGAERASGFDRLQASNLIRVPVVDAEGRLIGIVARRDLIRGYLNYGGDPERRAQRR